MSKKVAIILVNYNGYKDTLECMQSILNITYDDYDIFVVDNASTEEISIVENSYIKQNAKIIISNKNIGFSGGNNLAIREALKENYDYVLLLNNDTIVTQDFLNKLVEAIAGREDYGIAVGKIYCYYDKDKVWYAGGEYNRRTGITLQCGGHDRRELDNAKDVSFATGCMMLIPSSVIKLVGELDETFFLYSEDTDYSQRVIDAGYKIRYVPTAKIYHKVSSTVGVGSNLQQHYMMRNNLYMIKKYCNNSIVAHMSMLYQMLKFIIKRECKILPVLHGYFDFLQGKNGKII